MSKELTKATSAQVAAVEDISVSRVLAQATAVQQLMNSVMKQDVHFGVIPGTPKPTLYQPGADYLCMLFRMRTDFEIVEKVEQETRIAFTVRCRLYHITAGYEIGSGMGSANSRETKYMSQATAKVCPKCQKPAIIKGKAEYGGGWLCFQKKDGCGAKFPEGAKEIEGQSGQILGDKVWDLHNTLMKMACKRAKVAAVLTATAASDVFTQDVEDLQEAFAQHAPAVSHTPPAAKEAPRSEAPKASSAQNAATGSHAAPAVAPTAAAAASSPTTPATGTASGPKGESAPPAASPESAASAEDATPSHSDVDPRAQLANATADREPESDDDDELEPDDLTDVVRCYRWDKAAGNGNGDWVFIGNEPRRREGRVKRMFQLFNEREIQEDDTKDDHDRVIKGWRSRIFDKYGKTSTKELSSRETEAIIKQLEMFNEKFGNAEQKRQKQQNRLEWRARAAEGPR